jgi:hypothetical protein
MDNNQFEERIDMFTTLLTMSGLGEEKSLIVSMGEDSLVIMREKLSPWQLIYTVEELGNVISQLVERLERACANVKCGENPVNSKLLDMADIPDSALLDVDIDQGEIYITETFLPDFAADMIEGTNIKMEQLRNLLLSDEEI